MAVTTTWSDPSVAYPTGLDRNATQNLPAALWDLMISNLNSIGGATGLGWIDFTPTLTQGAGITITVTRARYCIIGKTAHVELRLACTSAGTGGSNIVLASMPAAITAAWAPGDGSIAPAGTFDFNDASAPLNYVGVATHFTSTSLVFRTNLATSLLGANPAVTIASGDAIAVNLSFEIA